jgi:hypothetical protein
MTGTDGGLFTHNRSRSYLNHLVGAELSAELYLVPLLTSMAWYAGIGASAPLLMHARAHTHTHAYSFLSFNCF